MPEEDLNPVLFSLSHRAVILDFSVFRRDGTVNGDGSLNLIGRQA